MTTADQSGITELQRASRYYVWRTWRQIRNGGTASNATSGANHSQVGVGLSLQGGELVQPRRDLVQDEKGDRCGNPDVADETADRIEKRGGP
jgi:hypothetical protein